MKIRIAVAVTLDGEWNACGWGRPGMEIPDKRKMDLAVEGVAGSEARYWVEAEVEIPHVKTVKGVVCEAS